MRFFFFSQVSNGKGENEFVCHYFVISSLNIKYENKINNYCALHTGFSIEKDNEQHFN